MRHTEPNGEERDLDRILTPEEECDCAKGTFCIVHGQLSKEAPTPLDTEVIEANLADYARRYFGLFNMYMMAWLREMGGVIRPKFHQIDGFVLRARDIYEKAQLVDRIKQIMLAELEKKSTAEELFDAVFKMLAENGKDKVPTN